MIILMNTSNRSSRWREDFLAIGEVWFCCWNQGWLLQRWTAWQRRRFDRCCRGCSWQRNAAAAGQTGYASSPWARPSRCLLSDRFTTPATAASAKITCKNSSRKLLRFPSLWTAFLLKFAIFFCLIIRIGLIEVLVYEKSVIPENKFCSFLVFCRLNEKVIIFP